MTQIYSDEKRLKTRRRKAGLGWTFVKSASEIRSLVAIFTFLFLLVMPIALMIIGRENFMAMAGWGKTVMVDGIPTTSMHEPYTPFGTRLPFNAALLPFHIIITSLALIAVIVMGSVLFRHLYRRETVDVEASMPLTRNQWFLGRALALICGLFIIFAVNAGATAGLMNAWGLNSLLEPYSSFYLTTFLASLVFAGLSAVIFSLAGRLFDSIIINVALHAVWPFSIYMLWLKLEIASSPPPVFTWLFAPGVDMFRTIFTRESILYFVILIVFWFVLAWFCSMMRPYEWGERKTGTLRWFWGIQPLFSMAGGAILGSFFSSIYNAFDRSMIEPFTISFAIGAVIGAFLGQIVSSVVTGKRLRRGKQGDINRKKFPPILLEWLWSLIGIAMIYGFTFIYAKY